MGFMSLDDLDHRRDIEDAVSCVGRVLAELLPAGPDDQPPPPDWPHWQDAHRLTEAKLLLGRTLRD
jgi:hypothetical protein